jgi:hypothetical protein
MFDVYKFYNFQYVCVIVQHPVVFWPVMDCIYYGGPYDSTVK